MPQDQAEALGLQGPGEHWRVQSQKILTKLHELEPPEQCEGGRRIVWAYLLSNTGGWGLFPGSPGCELSG